ncbi:hypothetical protein K435DRAFT_859853 [Dendrothele bispora CBS 962.96]|uniref:Uncharacterized protein n=1 Tax=Dendrothele bispora (strain CBS 962.96) TaxID=1314807 RepID=A0A4S8LZV2_DENBC|nr:hypothetical protein K435DRAFT_859853 [Dendrothele bispora CBS 962.96]
MDWNFDESAIAVPSRLQLTPRGYDPRTLTRIIEGVPFPATPHGGAPSTPSSHASQASPTRANTPAPSTPFRNNGTRRLDRTRTPATRESNVKRPRIVAHASPPPAYVQRASPGSIFDQPPDHIPSTPSRPRHCQHYPSSHAPMMQMLLDDMDDLSLETPQELPVARRLFPDHQPSAGGDEDVFGMCSMPVHHSPARSVGGACVASPRRLPTVLPPRHTDAEHSGQMWCPQRKHCGS